MEKDNRKIKAIIFDFMGVLLFKRDNYQPDILVDKIDQRIGQVTDDRKFKREVCREFGLSDKQFLAVLTKIISKYSSFAPLWKMLPKLKKTYRLGIINNGIGLTLKRFRIKYRLDKKFDVFISSALEKKKKPSPNIYLLTSRRLGVKPEECLFMDDLLDNIRGARKVGMKTIWWKNEEIGFKKFIDWLN